MRKAILILLVFLTSCSSDTQYEKLSRELQVVEPVYAQNGLYNKVRGRAYVNIQWYTNYDFPTYQPYYNTIKMNGVVVADFYTEQFNRFSIQVPSTYVSATFSISQTVIGVGTSEEVFLTVSK